jgi:hypothetical protein
MWLDLSILALIAFLAGFGARSGAAVAGLRLAALPLAYAGAIAAAWAFGPALGSELGWREPAGALLAGTIGLVVVQLLLGLGTRALRNESSPPPASQALGAVFGALRGALFALPILWLAGLSEGARLAGVRPDLPARRPGCRRSAARCWAQVLGSRSRRTRPGGASRSAWWLGPPRRSRRSRRSCRTSACSRSSATGSSGRTSSAVR